MNILFLNSARSRGGNELWSTVTANALAERGHDVCFAMRSDFFKDMLSDKINIIEVPFKHELDTSTYSLLNNAIDKHKIDILLPTKQKEYFIAGRIGKKRNLPVAFRLGIARNLPKWDIYRRFVFKKYPSAVIVNASNIKELLVQNKIIEPEKIKVIYNGYDFPDSIADFIEADLPKDKFMFAAAGRLTAQKGYDLLLRACVELNKTRNDYRVIVAGDGGEKEDYLKFIEENNLEDTVHLIGHISNVRGFLQSADAVLIPSRNEGIPNTLFEAWSLKKPVITSDAAGLPEAMRTMENGIMCALDPDKIAEAMKYFLEHSEEIEAFGKAGYKTMKDDFSLEKSISGIEGLLTELC
ncbi:MAG: glycosyltransferase family 4 protein, partial [Chlorobi bacterium]|nr:glycosyltransferase family 4 protein [Chlorobiota bacterium]